MKFRFLKLLSLVLLTMMVINPVAAATPAGPDKVLSPSVVSAQATDTLYQRDVEDTPPPISTEFIRRPVSELTELASTTALPGFGTISGTVRGFQACDINPAPLAGSTVNFRQAGLIVYSTLTNASGLYTYDLPVGIYDVDFVAPGYLIVYQASVQITDGGLVTSNKDLRLLAPCFTVSPTFLEKTQPTNTIANQTLTLSNSGAEAGDFILTETAAAKMILNQLIVDPGFEAYTPNPYWNEYSAAYGTPLCTYLDCGILGPHGGDVWAWFGGSDTGDTAYLSQSVVIPTGIANLSFWVQQPFCGNGGANDWLALKIDNQELWRTDMTNPICGTLAYRQISVDVTAFADGGTHEVRFDSVLLGNGSFFLDDVELNRETTVNIPWLSETPVTGTVPANGSVDLTITYNSTGLTTGDYFAGLRINNPMLAPVNIPVTLHVLDLIPLTITANAATKVFGQPDPVFTYTASDPSVPLTGALSRVAGENVGVYAITQGTLSAGSNYAITFVSANFTITPKPLTITANAATKVFGQPDPVFTYTASDPAAPLTGALSREPGENVGVYAITQGTLSAGSNYAITFVSANFTITAKPLTITADAATKVFGQPDPVFTYTASDPSVPLTGALSRVAGENVGVYAITQGTLSAGSNYAITFVSADFTITAVVFSLFLPLILN